MKRISLVFILVCFCLTVCGQQTINPQIYSSPDSITIIFELVSPSYVKLLKLENRRKESIRVKLDGHEEKEQIKPGGIKKYVYGRVCSLIQWAATTGSFTVLNADGIKDLYNKQKPEVAENEATGSDSGKPDEEAVEPEQHAIISELQNNGDSAAKPAVAEPDRIPENPVQTEPGSESERQKSVESGEDEVRKTETGPVTSESDAPDLRTGSVPAGPAAGKLPENTTPSETAPKDSLSEHDSSVMYLPQDGTDGLEKIWQIVSGSSVPLYTLILLATAAFVIIVARKRGGVDKVSSEPVRKKADGTGDAEPMVILQKTHDIVLKKQSLDDVGDNDSYFVIDSSEFCTGSSIRKMYLKNTCIKDIYKMYADDLRNPDKPDEDGCMVLGRWVCRPEDGTYDISLEYVVRPGDDAVFQEYELNFGGKIKMKVSEKLRKLRKDTGLQYDLTCWVHSHPGIGVFFSNYDSNVQMQLKHPVHPRFLSAVVVDILTPGQDFGIFSFRQDESVISGNDLKRLYSLEELYRWAVVSERKHYRQDDYYDMLKGAGAVAPGCETIEMSNNSIIDICSIVMEHPHPSTYSIYGYPFTVEGRNGIIVQKVSAAGITEGNELVGCLCTGTHCSIPTIRKVLSPDMEKYKFVLFYSSVNGDLTAIPIMDGQIVTDERYYVQIDLETLKLWTRRRR